MNSVTIAGQVYTLRKPTCERVAKLQGILGIDLFTEISKAQMSPTQLTSKLDSQEKTLKAMKICLGDDIPASFGEFTPVEASGVVSLFFSAMQVTLVEMPKDQRSSADTKAPG